MKFTTEEVYRFLWGDMPLFACQQWISEPESLTFFSEVHQQALQELAAKKELSSEQLHQEIAAIFKASIHEGKYLTWVLQQVLPWIIKEDSRACHGIDVLHDLEQQGLGFLSVISSVYLTGKNAGHFDWNAVRENVPTVKPGALYCLDMLNQGHIRIEHQRSYFLADFLHPHFAPVSDWKSAEKRHQQMISPPSA